MTLQAAAGLIKRVASSIGQRRRGCAGATPEIAVKGMDDLMLGQPLQDWRANARKL